MFDIGELVVCVDSSKAPHTVEEIDLDVPNWVVKGQRYTIRGFNENDGIVVGVLLEEVVNPLKYFRLVNRVQEPAFAKWRFRKLSPIELNELEEEELQIDFVSSKLMSCN
jgi:hypothetical protein